MRIAFYSIVQVLSAAIAFAQERDNEIDLRRITEDLSGLQDSEISYEHIYENLAQILSSPYELNKVTGEELRLLHILSDEQIRSLIGYREKQGNFLDVYELQAVPGLDAEAIEKLLPFVKVSDPNTIANPALLRRLFGGDNAYVIARYERTLERRNGFRAAPGNTPSFAGSADKLYLRLRSTVPGDYSFGMTGEKDAGEKLSLRPRQHRLGFDFTSLHFQLQNKGKIKNLIAGDFQAQLAQGLLLGGAFGLGKGGGSIENARKSNLGFIPYTAAGESAFQRGLAITLAPLKVLLVSGFYSDTRRDASNGADSLTVSSLLSTGLHRTAAEIANRKRVREQHGGLVLQLSTGTLDAGVMITSIRFGIPLATSVTPYNQFAFRSGENTNVGAFLNYSWHNVSFFSEVGQSVGSGTGAVGGVLFTPHRNLDVALVYRHYARDFYTFYSNAFAENAEPQNERGAYWAWRYRWSRRMSVNGYADLFVFPWLGYRRYAPAHGYEWLLRASYQPSGNGTLIIQMREESKPRNAAQMTTLYQLYEGQKRNFSLHCDYRMGEKLRLTSRIQFNTYGAGGETTKGLSISQDVRFKWGRFQFTARHALFDAGNYDNRHYTYEHDAWLAYSLPAYSGVGVRNYALMEYKLHKNVTVWMRYARTELQKSEEIGSARDRNEGNTRNDVKFQVRFKF